MRFLDALDHPLMFFFAVTLIAVAGPIVFAALANRLGQHQLAKVLRPDA